MSEQRRRGRPRGTGKKDAPHLARVADLITSNPTLAPTTAMNQIIAERADWPETEATLLRRWQIKWRASSASFMEAARARAAPKPMVATGGGGPVYMSAIDRMLRDEQRMRDLIDPPHMRVFRGATASLESAMQKVTREQQQMRDLIDSPFQRELRRMNDMQRELQRINEMQRLMRGW
jgi:hypothetical protein